MYVFKEYTAHGHVRYGFMNRRDGGILEIWKLFNDKSICFSSVLLDTQVSDLDFEVEFIV